MQLAQEQRYIEVPVSIHTLFDSEETDEPSERALRERQKEGFLFFIRYESSTQIYDKQLSVIKVKAARACKQPRIYWRDLVKAFKEAHIEKEFLIEQLNGGLTDDEVIHVVMDKIDPFLDTDWTQQWVHWLRG